jgi:hypothetical protein
MHPRKPAPNLTRSIRVQTKAPIPVRGFCFGSSAGIGEGRGCPFLWHGRLLVAQAPRPWVAVLSKHRTYSADPQHERSVSIQLRSPQAVLCIQHVRRTARYGRGAHAPVDGSARKMATPDGRMLGGLKDSAHRSVLLRGRGSSRGFELAELGRRKPVGETIWLLTHALSRRAASSHGLLKGVAITQRGGVVQV